MESASGAGLKGVDLEVCCLWELSHATHNALPKVWAQLRASFQEKASCSDLDIQRSLSVNRRLLRFLVCRTTQHN